MAPPVYPGPREGVFILGGTQNLQRVRGHPPPEKILKSLVPEMPAPSFWIGKFTERLRLLNVM